MADINCRLVLGPKATIAPCKCTGRCELDGRTKPPEQRHWDEPFLDAIEPMLAKYRDSAERQESLQMQKALRLAPTLGVCEALLAGESVPGEQLDPYWVRKLGLR